MPTRLFGGVSAIVPIICIFCSDGILKKSLKVCARGNGKSRVRVGTVMSLFLPLTSFTYPLRQQRICKTEEAGMRTARIVVMYFDL